MNISAITSSSSVQNVATLQSLRTDMAETKASSSKAASSGRDPVAVKKAASQFEAIILRQLLAPSIEPIMSGGLGGGKDSGGGIYGYMLTDSLANNMAKAGGLGLGNIIEKQLTPRGVTTDNQGSGSSAVSAQKLPFELP